MEKIKETSDLWVRMQLNNVSKSILEYKEELTKKRFIRNNYMLELKERGYTYKQIAEISGCSTAMCFKEILKHERLIKEWKKASSIY
jgi:hypothetical protein